MVKNPSAIAGDLGSIPGLEDPLEEEMATQPSILAWEIPWTKEAGGLQSMGSQSDVTEHMSTACYSRTTINNLHFFLVVLDSLHKFVRFFFFYYFDQVLFSFASPPFSLNIRFLFFFFLKLTALSL